MVVGSMSKSRPDEVLTIEVDGVRVSYARELVGTMGTSRQMLSCGSIPCHHDLQLVQMSRASHETTEQAFVCGCFPLGKSIVHR